MKRQSRKGAKPPSRASGTGRKKRAAADAASAERIEELFDPLYDMLREAKHMQGRAGAIHALKAVTAFLTYLKPVTDEGLHLSLVHLCDALAGLDDGVTHPILQKARRRGRARDSEARRTLKGFVAFTVQSLCATGMMGNEARRAIAHVLRKEGVAPTRGRGPITKRTVRLWCDEVAADVGGKGEAAQAFDQAARYFEPVRLRFADDPKAIRCALLESLAYVARGMPTGKAS